MRRVLTRRRHYDKCTFSRYREISFNRAKRGPTTSMDESIVHGSHDSREHRQGFSEPHIISKNTTKYIFTIEACCTSDYVSISIDVSQSFPAFVEVVLYLRLISIFVSEWFPKALFRMGNAFLPEHQEFQSFPLMTRVNLALLLCSRREGLPTSSSL
jgi:hypothetical protein